MTNEFACVLAKWQLYGKSEIRRVQVHCRGSSELGKSYSKMSRVIYRLITYIGHRFPSTSVPNKVGETRLTMFIEADNLASDLGFNTI